MVMIGPIRETCGKCDSCKKTHRHFCSETKLEDHLLYGKLWGGFSTHVQLRDSHVYKMPKNLDYKTAGPLMCAGITTFAPLNKYAKKGDKVAIIGCGGLGHFAVQWAAKMGCEVHIFSSSHRKDELA
jgi:D-arabinose 1-dehydrogenase-like Zn-dependent alcohol dehydrogenase